MNWLSALPMLLRILGWIMGRSGASNDTLKAYYKFIEKIVQDEALPAKLRDSAMSQRERILAKIGATDER